MRKNRFIGKIHLWILPILLCVCFTAADCGAQGKTFRETDSFTAAQDASEKGGSFTAAQGTSENGDSAAAQGASEKGGSSAAQGAEAAGRIDGAQSAEKTGGSAPAKGAAKAGGSAAASGAGKTGSSAAAEDGPGGEDPASEEEITEITFTAVGDNLINEVLYGQAAEYAAKKGDGEAYDFAPLYAQAAPFIQEHDVNWIDVETLMTDTCEPAGYPAFSTPGDSGRALYDAGWRVFSLCSNHTYDLGARGLAATLEFWNGMKEEAGKAGEELCTTGLWENGTEEEIPVLDCKGKKLAFLTYTYGTNGIRTPSDAAAHVIYLDQEETMARQIRLAREQADAVIVSLHWGEEYSHEPTGAQRDLAQRAADMGADLIIGGHPHVVQEAEMLTASDGREVFCAYSLGNFICAQNSMPDPDAMIGLLLSCTFRFEGDSLTVTDHRLIPLVTDYGEDYAGDHVVLYADYTPEKAAVHGMRAMFGFTQFDYDYVERMLTEVVGRKYLDLPR